MKELLIIGGTGTISAPITALAAKNPDYHVTLLNRGNHPVDIAGVDSLIGDINDFEKMQQLLKDKTYDCVISFLIFSKEQAEQNYALFKEKTKQFIFISTAVVSDRTKSCRFDETSEYGNAFSEYGQGKEACEKYFLKKYEEEGFPVTIVRPTQTYSNHRIPLSLKGSSCWSVISRMLKGKEVIIHGDGQNVWPSTHADDFARFFMVLICNPCAIGEIYLIANPKLQTFDDIYRKLADIYQVEYKPVYIPTDLLSKSQKYDWDQSIGGDKRFSCVFDISKIQALNPGLEFEIDVDKGLELFAQYMKEHPQLCKEDEAFDAWCDAAIEKYKALCAAMCTPEF
jgi:nucleoside-diphosphate-sugar epimerase